MNLGLSYNYSDQYEMGLQSCDTGDPPSEMPRWNAQCVAEAHIGLNNTAEAIRYANAVLEDGIVDPVAEAIRLADGTVICGICCRRYRSFFCLSRYRHYGKSDLGAVGCDCAAFQRRTR